MSGVVEETGFRIQVTGAGAMGRAELWVVSCVLTSGHRRLPAALEAPAGRFDGSTTNDKMSPHVQGKDRTEFKK